jgi:monothiol glutaredoxin
MSTEAPIQSYSRWDHEERLRTNPVLLYMKGTPEEPLCGFSRLAVQILQQCRVPFLPVDVLHPDIRDALKQISEWPTFPQLYIQRKFIGGSDIIAALYDNGELQKKLAMIPVE